MNPQERSDHGWWPYVVPYVAFLLMSQVGSRMPDAADPWMLVIKPGIVLGLIIGFRINGAYPEWRGQGARIGLLGGAQDILVGLLLTGVWVAPYLLVPALRPTPGNEFDPEMAGESFVIAILVLRLFGYALVTPIFEELFIRSFVMRIADVWETDRDFRDQPIARYSLQSLIVTAAVFTLPHAFWEWWVCLPWVLLSSLWFYHRKSLSSIMLVHGVTNAALLALAIWGGGLFEGAGGTPFTFWFFV
jgi:CAAX prenyl protease-like protein